jgi:DNA-binding XRE family transcriptional regulator
MPQCAEILVGFAEEGGAAVAEGAILGVEVQKARKAAKLGQEELARMAGVSPTYLRQVEQGKRSPSLDALLRICGA